MKFTHLILLVSFALLSAPENSNAQSFGANCGNETNGRYGAAAAAGCFSSTPNRSTCIVSLVKGCKEACYDSPSSTNTEYAYFNKCKTTCTSMFGESACTLGGGGGSCAAAVTTATANCSTINSPNSAAEVETCRTGARACKTSCEGSAGTDPQRLVCEGFLNKISEYENACEIKKTEIKDAANGNPITPAQVAACKAVCKKAGQVKEDSCSELNTADATPEPTEPEAIAEQPVDEGGGEPVGPEPVTTPDQLTQQQIMQGISTGPVPNPNLSGFSTSSVDAMRNGNGFDSINSNFDNNYSPNAMQSPLPFEAPEYGNFGGGGKAELSQGSQGGGGGGAGGMGGAGMANNRPGAAPQRRGGMPGGPIDKTMGNAYFPPGGSKTGGGPSAKRATAATRPGAKVGPKYQNKGNDENLALARLFGSPRGQALGQNNPGNQNYYGNHCMDTVFCSMENFFQAVDRYPNSEIKDVKTGK